MRYFRKLNKATYKDCHAMGVEKSYIRQPSLVDSFYYTEGVCPETGEKTVRISHPLYMLFNQERLDRLGPEAVRQWLNSLDNAGSSSLNDLKKKCSDDDLLKMVKSRHFQHPCELERYLQDINRRAEYFNSEVARIVAEEKAAKEQQVIDNEKVETKTQ